MNRHYRLAHAIFITDIGERQVASYLHIAQPLTIRSMLVAQKMAASILDVELVAVRHKDAHIPVPHAFVASPPIEKYAWEYIDELRTVHPHKELPRVADILDSFYCASGADYFVYSNLDIGLQPDFYLTVASIIDEGYDAFCINRRDLPKTHFDVLLDESALELIYTIKGHAHPGIDCFVFRREWVPHLRLGNVFIGSSPIGQVLKTQIELRSTNFTWRKDLAVTFHIGQDSPWKSGGDYYKANHKAAEGLYVDCFNFPAPSFPRRVLNKLVSIGKATGWKSGSTNLPNGDPS